MVVKANKHADGIGGHLVHLRLLGRALRGRLQPLLPGQAPTASPATTSTSRATPRPASTPGPSSRAASTRTSSTTSARESRRPTGLSSYPHPRLMPDFWEFPTVSMGLGPINSIYQARFNRYLAQPPASTTPAALAGVVLPGRRRERRARDAGRDLAGRPRGARQPHLGRQLQPPAPRRPGARQRQDHPGARGHLPRRRLERHQGDLGLRVGRAAGPRRRRRAAQQDEHHRRRRVPALRGRVGRLHPRALLRPRSPPAEAGRAPDRRRPAQAAPRRPRLPQDLRRLQGGHRAGGRAHRHPGQDDQGLDARHRRRGAATPPTRSRR